MNSISPGSGMDESPSNVNVDEMFVPATSSSSAIKVTTTKQLLPKHIIRRIIPLDLNKLDQVGLDREIAEALSKHKSQQKIQVLSPVVIAVDGISHKNSTTNSKGFQEATASDKTPSITTKRVPPKITITGSDTLSGNNEPILDDLNAYARLTHAKTILNKKLLKKRDERNDNEEIQQHLQLKKYKLATKPSKEKPIYTTKLFKPMKHTTKVSTPSLNVIATNRENNVKTKTDKQSNSQLPFYENSQLKFSTTSTNEVANTSAHTSVSISSAEPSNIINPIFPQDIARKLDFQTDALTKAAHTADHKCTNFFNKDISEMEKVSLKLSKTEQSQNSKHLKEGEAVLTVKESNCIVNTSKDKKVQKISYPNEIPKASIKTVQVKKSKRGEKKIYFPEGSPLKTSFPTVSIPLDSFKEPHSKLNITYCDLQRKTDTQTDVTQTNQCLFNQEPTASHMTSNSPNDYATNNLIVLENKILTQAEMIDLTDLRLSTSKISTPRFITAHRPIPEVVIKQEHTDECLPTPSNIVGKKSKFDLQIQKNELCSEKLLISNKQNKKIIINAQKLKLPPEKLAELARKMKQTISASTQGVSTSNRVNKVQNILNTKTTSRKTSSKNTNHDLPHNTQLLVQTPKEVTENAVINNKQYVYSDAYKQDHNYQLNRTLSDFQTYDAINVKNSSPFEENSQLYFNKTSDESIVTMAYSSKKSEEMLADTCSIKISEDSASLNQYQKSAVEIIDEPVQNEISFSAIDFILAFGNVNSSNQDISLKLSAEEQNLSASCAIHLSSPNQLNEKTTSSQITSTPKIITKQNVNLLENKRRNSTIVIESSKGKETILTNESPNICDDIKKVNRLETMKVTQEIDNEKSALIKKRAESSFVHKTAESISDINSKLLDNIFVSDMEIEKSPETIIIQASPKERDNNIIGTKSNTMASNTLKEQHTIDFYNVTEINDPNNSNKESSTSGVANSTIKDLLGNTSTDETKGSIKVTGDDLNSENISEGTIISHTFLSSNTNEELDRNTQSVAKSDAITSSKSPEQMSLTNNNNITKLAQDIKTIGTSEMPPNSTVTSKRISKFKKGKINLVPRNKARPEPHKPLSVEQNVADNNFFNETVKHKDNIEIDEKVVETLDGLNKSSEKKSSSTESTNYIFTVIPAMNSKQNQRNIKETHVFQTPAENAEITANTVPPHVDIGEQDAENNLSQFLLQPMPDIGDPKNVYILNSTSDEVTEELSKQHYSNSPEKIDSKESRKTNSGGILHHLLTFDLSKEVIKNTDIQLKCSEISSENVTKVVQDDMDIPENCANIANQIEPFETLTSAVEEGDAITKNLHQNSRTKDLNEADNLSDEAKAIMQTIKTAKISLIDIVKHSPVKINENSPVIPLEKACNDTSLTLQKTHLNEVKSDSKENNNENKHSSRPGSKASKRKAETPTSTISSSKRQTTRPLISDDDLEFLPENAEVKFQLSKINKNVSNNECNTDIHKNVHSKPMQLEFFKPGSSPTKKTRYYSKTLETDVTITFDNIKSKVNVPKNLKPIETEESCHDSAQESCGITSSKETKKLCKTIATIKETKITDSDTDYEDDNRDIVSAEEEYDENKEFLGFEEKCQRANSITTQKVNEEKDHDVKKKHGTLKNWLTTGKTISPTMGKLGSTKRIRHSDTNERSELSPQSTVICDTKEQTPLENQWNLRSSPYEDTDITDDSSPADDEEYVNEEISINKKSKPDIEIVFDKNKKLVGYKTMKLNDSPKKVQTKHSRTDSDCYEEKEGKSQKTHSTIKSLENSSYKTKKSKKMTCVSESIEKMERKSLGNEKQLDKIENTATKLPASDFSVVKCSEKIMDSDAKDYILKKYATGSDCNISKTVTGDIDENLDIECVKNKTSNRSKSKEKNMDEKKENLNIAQQHEIAKIPTNWKDENKTNSCAVFMKNGSYVNTNTPQRQIRELNSEKSVAAEEAENSITPQTFKRKRGRPKRQLETPTEDAGASTSISKRSLKFTSKLKFRIQDSDSDTPLNTSKETTPRLPTVKSEKRARGRKRNSNEDDFNARLLLITNREQLDTEDVLTETEPGSGSIQCGLCLSRTEPAKWSLHLAQHYGIGWKVGEEKLHVENRSTVISSIIKYMKNRNCNGLTCRICKKLYRSGLGILTHIESCGAETVRVMCEFCNREYVQTSFAKHIITCSARNSIQNHSADESNGTKEEIFCNTGRIKRNSTIKAENKLKVLGEELERTADNVKKEKPDVDPKSRIRYVPPLQGDFTAKWSKDIKEFGLASCPKARCKFNSNIVETLSEHLEKCKYKKSGYICNFCRRMFKDENEAIQHVRKNHQKGRSRKDSDDADCDLSSSDGESSDVDENEFTDDTLDDEDDRDAITSNKTIKPNSRAANLHTGPTHRKSIFDGRSNNLTEKVFRKWRAFLRSNYSCETLYAEFKSQYCVINQPDLNKYLPAQKLSMKFSFGSKESLITRVGVPQEGIEWSELKKYESISSKNNTYFFLGAPIKLCIWVPLPKHVSEQYLAVVYRQEMFKYIKTTQPKEHQDIVVIFKVTKDIKLPKLNMHYGFIVNDGPVHHISFLPSGGYDESSNRLGLVAVGTVNSCIKVYSLPIVVELATMEDNNTSITNLTLIDVKASFVLNIDISNNQEEQQHSFLSNTQCLQISWSEYSNHQHIFAGFSNGFVGIWEIVNNAEQNLNRFEVDDIINYVPLNYFYVGEKCAKCIALHYDTSGPRWLAVSTAYRKFIIYDIRNFVQPVIMKEDINKNILLSMDWCPVWEPIIYSYCNLLPTGGRSIMTVNPNNIMFTQNKLELMSCGITQVHYTPITNMCVAALCNGDIAFLSTKELHYECALNKKFGERRMQYSLDVKRLNGQSLVMTGEENQEDDTSLRDWNMFDVDYKEKYGLVFQPLIKITESDKSAYTSENRTPPANVVPLMRINTLRCNLNRKARYLIALGYDNGFLRVINFNAEAHFRNYRN